jgi:hypothetical protein
LETLQGHWHHTTVTRKIEAAVKAVRYLAPYKYGIGVTIVAAGTTYLTLVDRFG